MNADELIEVEVKPFLNSLIDPDAEYDIEDLLSIFSQQSGRCALSRIMMTYADDVYSIAIDRIDHNLGYTPDNIQLVCKWVGLVKQDHTNDELSRLLSKLRTDHLELRLFNGLSLECIAIAELLATTFSDRRLNLSTLVRYMGIELVIDVDDFICYDNCEDMKKEESGYNMHFDGISIWINWDDIACVEIRNGEDVIQEFEVGDPNFCNLVYDKCFELGKYVMVDLKNCSEVPGPSNPLKAGMLGIIEWNTGERSSATIVNTATGLMVECKEHDGQFGLTCFESFRQTGVVNQEAN